jgi:hypothetical protein
VAAVHKVPNFAGAYVQAAAVGAWMINGQMIYSYPDGRTCAGHVCWL